MLQTFSESSEKCGLGGLRGIRSKPKIEIFPNSKPRKVLNFSTPLEFFERVAVVALQN